MDVPEIVFRGQDDAQIPSSAIACLYQGKLIDAIKKTREEQGLGLKDAKAAVERYLAANPTVKARFKSAAAANSSGVVQLIRIVAIAGVLTLAYLWFTGRLS